MLGDWEEFSPKIGCKGLKYWKGNSFICVPRPRLKEFLSGRPNRPSPELRFPAGNDRMLGSWEELPPRIRWEGLKYWKGNSFICVSLSTRLTTSSRPLLKGFPSRSLNGPSPEPRFPDVNDRMLDLGAGLVIVGTPSLAVPGPSTSILPSVAVSGTTRLPFSVDPLGAARALASLSILPLRNQRLTSCRLTWNVGEGTCISHRDRGGKDLGS